jgi:hypothetical protein
MKRRKSTLSVGVILVATAALVAGLAACCGPGPETAQIAFTADHTSLVAGECTTLRWHVPEEQNVALDGQLVNPSGQRDVCPTETTTYQLSVGTGGELGLQEITIVVADEEPPGHEPVGISFTADRTSLKAGECTTLHWDVQGGYGVFLNGGDKPKSGQQGTCPDQTVTYSLCVDTGEANECREITIVVTGEEPPGNEPVEISFTADRMGLRAGECATLHWDVQGGYGVFLNGDDRPRSGQEEACPDQSMTYSLCVDTGGAQECREIIIVVADEEPPGNESVEISFTADRTNLKAGECATLHWDVQGGYGVFLNGDDKPQSGQEEACPNQTSTYSLCVDMGEPHDCREITIVVTGEEPPPTPPPPTLSFTFSPTSGPPGTEVELYLSTALPVTVYYNGVVLAKRTSEDGKTLTVAIPGDAWTGPGSFELRWDGQGVLATQQFTVTPAPVYATVILQNNSTAHDIWHAHISPPDQTSWGADLLPGVLTPGESHVFYVPPGVYDLMADDGNSIIDKRYGVNLSGTYRWIIDD